MLAKGSEEQKAKQERAFDVALPGLTAAAPADMMQCRFAREASLKPLGLLSAAPWGWMQIPGDQF